MEGVRKESHVAEQAVSQACAGALLFDFAAVLAFAFAFALGTQATHTSHKCLHLATLKALLGSVWISQSRNYQMGHFPAGFRGSMEALRKE